MSLQLSASPTPEPALSAVHKILVVDDSAMQRRILTTLLKRWGYQVIEATCAEDGLEICRDTTVQFVLSDWMMPGMTGKDFCEEFRKIERQSYGYFLMLTAKGDTLDIADGLNVGADDFMIKPVNPAELQARLRAGERIVEMHDQLLQKNELITDTLSELQTLYDALNKDLEDARTLQLSLVREREVTIGNHKMSFLLKPSGHVGGDLVGHFPISESCVGLFGIDVSGHGVSSALLTSRLAGLFASDRPERNIALKLSADGTVVPRDPARVAEQLNRILLKEVDTTHYITMAYAEVNTVTGAARLVQAGHPHPIVQRRDGALEQLGNGGLPIGLMEDAQFEAVNFQLNPGDRLLVLSDGVSECPFVDEQNMLEEEGVLDFLFSRSGVKGHDLFSQLLEFLQTYSGLEEFPDDVSAALFEFNE